MKFLQRCSDTAGLHIHLTVRPGTGGDSVAVIEGAHRRLAKESGRPDFSEQIVLLDADRIQQDIRQGRDARAAASRYGFKVILQQPNLEGLLLRLCPGQERRHVAPEKALTELRKHWPQYRKPPTAQELYERFDLGDLRRVAQHDPAFRELLDILEL
ncbi:MAG: hypothetical protein OXM56_02890 [Gammaproteobacteria bacterium]|nr:hypothetical protein [Gammaproteobacteria bacterium]